MEISTKTKWVEYNREYEKSESNAKEFCEKKGINFHNFKYHRSQIQNVSQLKRAENLAIISNKRHKSLQTVNKKTRAFFRLK